MSNDLVIPVGSAQLELVRGNITKIAVDAIVNAANSNLAGGGGVDGAIHSAGGPEIMQELDSIRAKIGSCPAGSAVVTGAGRLPAKYVFHAVGPIYLMGIMASRRHWLLLSHVLEPRGGKAGKAISFPSISTGIYGYPIKAAAALP